MARCTGTRDLDVHHIRRDAGNGMDNARVLCSPCHQATATYGVPGKSPPPFGQDVKDTALQRAGYRCECTSSQSCH